MSLLLAGVIAATAASLRAQDPSRTPQDPAFFQESVKQMEGKPVRAIRVRRAERRGEETLPVDPQASESLVRSLQTRVGQPFEARKIANDCNTLWEERRVVVQCLAEEVENEVVVTYIIEAEVAVYDDVAFVDNNHFDQLTIEGLLGLGIDRQVTRTEAEAMRKVLLARYRRDGYAFCGIKLVESDVDGTGRTLRFEFDEGPEVAVRAVRFLGNTSYAARTPLRLQRGDFLLPDAGIDSRPGVFSDGVFSREVLEEDLDKLRLFYRTRGYLDANVDVADVRFTPDRTGVEIDFVVVEGPRYKIRSVRVQHVDGLRAPIGTTPLYSPELVEQELKVRPGTFYDGDALQRDVQRLQDFYGRRGHPPWNFPGMADVQQGCRVFDPLEVYGEGTEVDVVFQVSEGVPKKLHDVLLRGNRFTRDHVIRRRVRVLPGDTIDMVEVRRALTALQQTRYFEDPTTAQGPRLQLEPVPGQPDYVNFGIDAEDGATGELRWGVGISTGQGAQAQVTFNKRNFDLWNPPSSANPITAIGEILDNRAFHGGGQQLSTLLAPGTRFSQFQVTWSDPDIFRHHFETYELRVSGRRLIQRLPDGYTSDLLGAEVFMSRNFTELFNVGVGVRHETVEIDSLASDATQLAFDAEGSTELRGARAVARLRDLDDPMRPTQGYEFSLAADLVGGPLGGDESLTKYTHTANVFTPLFEDEVGRRTVFHFEHLFGYAEAFGGSDDVFVTQRFYMGGASLRGFDFRDAGPKQFGRPIGGEAIYTATAEVIFPLVATRLEGQVKDTELIRGVLFTDLGLLGLSLDDETFREPRLSVGFGVRIQVPYMNIPIALDLGWPLIYEESDDRRQLYFSISP